MSRPNHCPNCGEALEGEFTANAIIVLYRHGDGGYDCSCGACGWTGDILPDDERVSPRVS